MNNMFDLTGKKAIIVGGAGDLGSGMMRALAEAGAEVACIDLSETMPQLINALNDDGYKAHAVKADISRRDEVRSSYQRALELLGGRLDILINSAGIQRRYPSEEFPEKDWDEVLEINLTALFLYCQLAANTMIPNGGGKIINIASMQSFIGGVTIPAYAAAKGGVGQLTKTLANDWAAKGINVNAIAPGYMDTRLNTGLIANKVRSAEILTRIPQKRWGNGDDLKGIAVFLASRASDYVNGAVIPVDGGFLGR